MTGNRVQVRIDPDLVAWLAGRAQRAMTQESPDRRLRTEVLLWRGHLAAELKRQRWTLPQIGCIADILNRKITSDTIGSGRILGAVADAVAFYPGSYGAKWGILENDLIARLARLCPTGDHALTDAVATWWQTQSDREDAHSPQGWARVGVVVVDELTTSEDG